MKKFILLKILILFTGKVISDDITKSSAPATVFSAPPIANEETLKNVPLLSTADIIHYGNSDPKRESWQVIPDHDLSGGILRVSGDGPKPGEMADPVVDVGLETYSPAKKITSHPNYIYLSPLTECGFPAIMDQYDKDEELKDEIVAVADKETRVKRIVGGKTVPPQRHPWMIQLYFFNISSLEHSFHCAGTLISNRTILTAAHCLTRLGPATTLDVVVVGNVDRRKVIFCKTSKPEENCSRSHLRDIEDFEVHEAYSEGNLNHDIALIYLRKPVKINAYVRPICLPYSSDLLEKWNDLKLTALGWGSTNKFGNQGVYLSDLLKQVQFDLQPRSLCDKFHQRIYGKIKYDRICTGGNIGRASCNGDSGGAVVKALELRDMTGLKMERVFQFGVVSAGGHPVETCGSQGRPAIDTNVFFFMDWILNHIVPGVQSYKYVDSHKTPYWAELPNSGSPNAKPTNNMPEFKGKLDANGNVLPDYLNDFSTGVDVDVSQHPNNKLLANIMECGSLPVWNEKVVPEPDSETRRARDTKGILETHIESIAKDEDVVVREKRIVGGVPVNLEGYYPWMAQIYVRNVEGDELGFRCSGTIISNRHVITAAHCVTEITPPFVLDSIVVGQYNRNHTEECYDGECYKPVHLKVTGVLIHPDYEKYTRKNNIALMRLSEELNYTRFVSPVCLPRKERLINAIEVKRYFTAGWGRVQRDSNSPADSRMSEILLQMYVDILPRQDCDFVYSRSIDLLDRSRFCGGGKASQGECLGDGGSPLMKKMVIKPDHILHNKFFQFGIVSFADCGMQGMPTVYMNIIHYMEWILDNLDNPDLDDQ